MIIKELKQKIYEKNLVLRDLRKQSDNADSIEELRDINLKMSAILEERDKLEDQLFKLENDDEEDDPRTRVVNTYYEREKRNQGSPQFIPGMGFRRVDVGLFEENKNLRSGVKMQITQEMKQHFEQRGADLKNGKAVTFDMNEIQLRSVTIGSGSLVVEKKYSDTLNPAFNEVSSLIDVVNTVPLPGGESYTKGFVVGYGEGDYTDEGADYAEAEPKFDYVETGKVKITAYCEISNEAVKLPNVDYQAEIQKAIITAIRKKAAKQIITGSGSGQLTGIYNAPSKCIPTNTDIEISAIDEDTLDKLIFAYGGAENVEGGTYLILNKKDLAAFAAVRDAEGKKLYKITLNDDDTGGTISSENSYAVKFIINSACNALSDSETDEGEYTMIYGKPAGYELPIFSPITVERSTDFKFKSGIVCYRGEVYMGGTPASYKGFIRVKKIAA